MPFRKEEDFIRELKDSVLFIDNLGDAIRKVPKMILFIERHLNASGSTKKQMVMKAVMELTPNNQQDLVNAVLPSVIDSIVFCANSKVFKKKINSCLF